MKSYLDINTYYMYIYLDDDKVSSNPPKTLINNLSNNASIIKQLLTVIIKVNEITFRHRKLFHNA